MILLVHPPVTKPCEPPAGLSRLAGALRDNDIPYRLIDLNLEGMKELWTHPPATDDTWTRRAWNNREGHLKSLSNGSTYTRFDRYKRAVLDLNRLLAISPAHPGIRLSLDNYEDESLSPASASDLIHAAQHPEENPFYHHFSHRLHEIIEEEQPLMIGFSLTYLSQALCTFAMIGFVRSEFPAIQIVVGGGLITSWTKCPTWGNFFEGLIDHIVSGPGEIPLLSILGKGISRNTAWRPAYNFEHLDGYLAPGLILPYSTSSGCYWGRCNFCPERAEGNRYVQRPPHEVVRELHRLVKDTKPTLIHITDNAISPVILRALAQHPPGAPWYGFVRITEYLADPDFCIALRNSGCVMLKLGVESGEQRVLNAMRKGNDLATTARALKAVSDAGIATYVYLLFGTPYESEEDAQRTLDFVVLENRYINFMNLAIFNLPLLSPDAQVLGRRDFYDGNLSLYSDFVHPKGWDRKKIRRFLDQRFRKHPSIRPILQNQPPFFTSNHAPFFTEGFIRSVKPADEPKRVSG